MTPREPDRFDKQARELMDSECPHEPSDEIPCVLCLADFLREAESSALERAAQVAGYWTEAGRAIRALIPPAAAPAAEPDGKAQGTEALLRECDDVLARIQGHGCPPSNESIAALRAKLAARAAPPEGEGT